MMTNTRKTTNIDINNLESFPKDWQELLKTLAPTEDMWQKLVELHVKKNPSNTLINDKFAELAALERLDQQLNARKAQDKSSHKDKYRQLFQRFYLNFWQRLPEITASGNPYFTALNNGYDVYLLKKLGSLSEDETKLIINATDSDKNSLLHLAVIGHHTALVVLLLKLGINHLAQNSQGDTALHVAAANGYADIVEILLKYDPQLAEIKGREERTSFHCAAFNGKIAAISVFLAHRADINSIDTISKYSALEIATINNHPNLIKFLLEHGAELHSSHNNKTLLQIAAQQRIHPVEAAQTLLEAGLDPNEGSVSPLLLTLMYAQPDSKRTIEFINLLLAHQADISKASPDGMTPAIYLHKLSESNKTLEGYQIDMMNRMKEMTEQVNKTTHQENTIKPSKPS